METNKTALCVIAHPDDAEFQCAGTLALLAERGWKIVMATMTPGQAGSTVMGPEEISVIRRVEASMAAAMIGAEYHCLECEDIFIAYDRPTLMKAIQLVRKVRPSLVITASPSDYIVDHEMTSKIMQTACLAAGIPNIPIAGMEAFSPVPHLYYCEPTHGRDIFGTEIQSAMHVDISSVMELKVQMLKCHKSQRDWLRQISELDEFVVSMEDYCEKLGRKIGRSYAEGFRQHLGFSYPADNLLAAELGTLLHISQEK
ncbi:PIG-L deacetylase family protein [Dyadobacter sp. LHD-138]|uniref:PIG-L deacetylase family protein n=1 Tax=Dyadobacter sp. LHD-138 TaxID=3071413 RepID=UPI0027E0DAA0|nr:PIG-L deacetylase family protein [Dyadobacter sp. LHD-138]MDQ6479458.1 PIG-L deacetylase family protein [Dyadobacter sp. LHD-138]